MLAAILALAGCGAGGFSLEQAEVDRSLITNSVAPESGGSEGIDADRAAIGNAVSSAIIGHRSGEAIVWTNAGTGARGTITHLAEARRDGHLCRNFAGSRESFDGVAMFEGRACLAGPDAWHLETLKVL